MTTLLTAYLAGWITACLLAVALMILQRDSLALLSRRYARYLTAKWKLVTFVIAASIMTLMAPWSGDPTWDYVDASLMSVLTYLTAPWASGTLYLALRGRASWRETYIAICLWMFSASWSYDGYILLRDGYYPATWQANFVLSSILYCSAGMLWNLQWRPGRGVVFGFMAPGWPDPAADVPLRRVMPFALPFMILASLLIAPFLLSSL